jgi:predicted protein tyrosine phosphatase
MSSHPLLPLGYSEAAMFLRSPEGPRVQAIISIHGKHEFGVEASVPHRLDLEFDDVVAGDETDPIAMCHIRIQRQRDADDGRPRFPPAIDHARAILAFAEAIKNLNGIVLCHCAGGIRRSPAAALLCLAQWMKPGEEQQCVETLASICPSASPHQDLVRFGDALLSRNGRLVAAVYQVLYGEGS